MSGKSNFRACTNFELVRNAREKLLRPHGDSNMVPIFQKEMDGWMMPHDQETVMSCKGESENRQFRHNRVSNV